MSNHMQNKTTSSKSTESALPAVDPKINIKNLKENNKTLRENNAFQPVTQELRIWNNTDVRMKFNAKAAIAESYLQNACFYISYRKSKSLSDVLIKLTYENVGATKTHHRIGGG